MENKSFKFIDPSSLPRSVDPYYFLKTLQGHFEEAERKKLVPQVWTENYPQVMQAYAALLKDLKKISPSKHEQFHPTTIRMVVADMRDTKVKRQIETWIEQNGKFLCRTYLLPSFFMKGALCTNETMQAVQDLKHTMSLSDYGFFLISTRGHEEEVDAFALGYIDSVPHTDKEGLFISSFCASAPKLVDARPSVLLELEMEEWAKKQNFSWIGINAVLPNAQRFWYNRGYRTLPTSTRAEPFCTPLGRLKQMYKPLGKSLLDISIA